MPGCAAIGCNNRSEKGYTMKCFPRNPVLRRIWKERVSRADWEPSNNSFLCHVHFDSDQWILSQSHRLKLKKNAIPSIFTVTSTRKSPRKRRKLINGQQEDFYYLDESLDPLLTVQNTIRNSFPSRYISTTIGAKNTSVSLNGMHSANGQTIDRKIVNEMTNSEVKIKTEMKAQYESDQDVDDIERKLRWICDGETTTNDKTEYANGCANNEKNCIEYSKEIVETTNEKDVKDIREAINRKRKSRHDIMRDIEKTVGFADEKSPKSIEPRKSKFTIKLTGLEEDVEEIVQSLSSEKYEYKSSNESSKNSRGCITSIISVIDDSLSNESSKNSQGIMTSIISVMDDSSGRISSLKKPKLEIEESQPDDKTIDWNWQENGNPSKLSIESPDDDEFSYKRLREKVKYQEELIRKLTEQTMTNLQRKPCPSNGLTPENHDRETTNKKRIQDNSSNCQESNDSLVNGLSLRLNNAEEINRTLNKRLLENEKERKKFELQIRQRDNRIKELNWKLDKASKYVERAEKNAITYRKKMINMQSLIARRKICQELPKVDELTSSEKNLENRIVQVVQCENITEVEEKTVAEDRNAIGDGGHYRTVQDIFDESNDCDDDPYVIDTREDFIRQFKDTFEPRV